MHVQLGSMAKNKTKKKTLSLISFSSCGKFIMYCSLKYITITCIIEEPPQNGPGEQDKGVCHILTQIHTKKIKKKRIPFPGNGPNPKPRAAERAGGAQGKAFTHEAWTNLLVGVAIN